MNKDRFAGEGNKKFYKVRTKRKTKSEQRRFEMSGKKYSGRFSVGSKQKTLEGKTL